MGYFYGSNAQIPGLLDYISKGSAARTSASSKTSKALTPKSVAPAEDDGTPGTTTTGSGGKVTTNQCASDADCSKYGANYRCVNGNCVENISGGTDETCSKGNKFPLPADGICPPGYVKLHYPDGSVETSSIPETGYSGPVCACLKYCESLGRSGVDCTDAGGGSAAALGEFKWPKEVEEYYKLLTSAGTNYLTNPGYSKAVLSAMFGTDFDKVRALETGTRNTMQGLLGREGLLGTGTAGRSMAQTAWNTESNIANLMRQLMIDNEAKKAEDIAAANNIFGSVTGYNQIGEAINAARRGEGQAAMAMLMQYILSIMSGWNK